MSATLYPIHHAMLNVVQGGRLAQIPVAVSCKRTHAMNRVLATRFLASPNPSSASFYTVALVQTTDSTATSKYSKRPKREHTSYTHPPVPCPIKYTQVASIYADLLACHFIHDPAGRYKGVCGRSNMDPHSPDKRSPDAATCSGVVSERMPED